MLTFIFENIKDECSRRDWIGLSTNLAIRPEQKTGGLTLVLSSLFCRLLECIVCTLQVATEQKIVSDLIFNLKIAVTK